jgi:nucleoid-associated protein EbfC
LKQNFMDMSSLLKNAKKIQEEMQRIQEELGTMTVEASSGGGMVTVVANGKQKIVSIRIEPEIIGSGDVKMLEDLVLAAVNEALSKSLELAGEKMGSVAGPLKIPGLF